VLALVRWTIENGARCARDAVARYTMREQQRFEHLEANVFGCAQEVFGVSHRASMRASVHGW